jgi:hypothetical protein
MPDSLLKTLLARATSPMLPEVANSGAALEQEISRPQLSDADHPTLAMLRGFGAGAVKGMGNVSAEQTSPASLISLLAGGMAKPVPKVAPSNFAPLGERLAEFAPVGAEDAYNAVRGAGNSLTEKVYQTILQNGGRGAR